MDDSMPWILRPALLLAGLSAPIEPRRVRWALSMARVLRAARGQS